MEGGHKIAQMGRRRLWMAPKRFHNRAKKLIKEGSFKHKNLALKSLFRMTTENSILFSNQAL